MAKYKRKPDRKRQATKMLAAMATHWSARNKEVFDDIEKQSTEVFWWKCLRGHEWRAKMAQVRSSKLPLCPACRGLHNKLKKKLKE